MCSVRASPKCAEGGFYPGRETADAQYVGVSPGENELAWNDGCSPDE